jgi:hypothetical protein
LLDVKKDKKIAQVAGIKKALAVEKYGGISY